MNKKKAILFTCVLLILFLAIFIRLQKIDGLYSEQYEKHLPKNPDGYYFLTASEHGESLRYDDSRISPELWYRLKLPNQVILFPLIAFIISYLLLFFILRNTSKSIYATIIPLTIYSFSIFLFYRTSVGFYDHDLIGIVGLFISILTIQNKEKLGKLFPYILSITGVFIFFLWGGLGRIAMFFLGFYFFYEVFYDKKKIKTYLQWLILTAILLFLFKPDQITSSYFLIPIAIMPFSLLKKQIFGTLPIIVLAGGVMRHFLEIRAMPSFAAENAPLDPAFLMITTGFILFASAIGGLKSMKNQNSLMMVTFISSFFLFFYNIRTLFVAMILMMVVLSYSIEDIENFIKKKTSYKHFFMILLFLLLLVPQVTLFDLNNNKYSTDEWEDVTMWIQENTEEGTEILAWWDNGYTIQYLAHRITFSDGGQHNYDKDLALFFTSGSEEEALKNISHLPVKYAIISQNELDKAEVIEVMSEREEIPEQSQQMMFRMSNEEDFNNLELVYKSGDVKVYKVY